MKFVPLLSSCLISTLLLFIFASEQQQTTASSNHQSFNNSTSATFDGIPVKQWIKQLKYELISSTDTRRSLRSSTTTSSPDDRGDIQVLKEYYQQQQQQQQQNGKQTNRKLKSSIFSSRNTSKNGQFDVIIIGAGWAGISAAMTLASKGITNYQVLEARDYIGGRSRTIPEQFNGEDIPIDIGSMWIHGGVDNPLYDILTAVGTKIPTFESQFTAQLYKANNDGPFTDQQYAQYYKNLYQNGFMPYQAKRQESTNRDEALQVSADKYANTISSNLETNVLKRILTDNIELEYSAPMEEMSLWWWDMDSFIGSSNDLFLPEGYSSLIEAYAAPVSDKVMLNAKVTKIDYRKNVVKVTYSKSGSQTILKCKKVIVTVPLGVLKANSILFVPKLPQSRRRSIQKLGMGHMNKIFMFWNPNDTFWPSDIELFSDIAQLETDFQFFNGEAYNGGKPMLFAFFAGDKVESIENEGSYEQEVTAQAMVVLRNMFGNDIKDPEKVVVTKWNQDEFSYGTYSFNKLGSGRNFRKILAKPIRNKRVYISGEATSNKFFSTTHGAHLSGITAANKVAQAL